MPDVSEDPKLCRITTLAGFKAKDLKVRRGVQPQLQSIEYLQLLRGARWLPLPSSC
jgi:hypothetical protein